MSLLTELSRSKSFRGYLIKYSHPSACLATETAKLSVYIPPQASTANGRKLPVVYCLAGLTCNEDNFAQKAGATRKAAELGIVLVFPDTSPRGANVFGEDESWDFGTGAGFYVDATEPNWKRNYNMYTYIVHELPEVIAKELPVDVNRSSLTGHSMGGHGALTIFLKNPGKYKSVTAFAPIANPMNCKWGQKAFTGYLGTNTENWKNYDATELIRQYEGPALNCLIDQGGEDQFLKDEQLLPNNFMKAANEKGRSGEIQYRLQKGYDHSYYFIATFMDDHLAHHARYL